jgi:hypothetical protein
MSATGRGGGVQDGDGAGDGVEGAVGPGSVADQHDMINALVGHDAAPVRERAGGLVPARADC